MKKRHPLDYYTSGLLKSNRVVLGQAITLVESHLPEDKLLAAALLDAVLPHTGKSVRIGITGVPGVGKSTFIESFGTMLTELGKKLAILTIDPSSQLTKGSILGDKTRMETLSKNENAFIRPSASGSVLGGVAHKTREAMLLCEAAGFDIIIVETVGTGQSETAVKNMVDFFLLLMLAGAGDELQGIKKGIMEMADALVITKADGENKTKASKAAAEYQQALHLFQPPSNGWISRVLTSSANENIGMKEIWETISVFETTLKQNEFWEINRKEQNVAWMHEVFHDLIKEEINQSEGLANAFALLEKKVKHGEISALHAAQNLLAHFKKV